MSLQLCKTAFNTSATSTFYLNIKVWIAIDIVCDIVQQCATINAIASSIFLDTNTKTVILCRVPPETQNPAVIGMLIDPLDVLQSQSQDSNSRGSKYKYTLNRDTNRHKDKYKYNSNTASHIGMSIAPLDVQRHKLQRATLQNRKPWNQHILSTLVSPLP